MTKLLKDKFSLTLFLILISAFALSACTEAQLAAHAVKNLPGQNQSKGAFKVGDPYKVAGKWYRPKETYQHTETGIASWYGPQFHGKKTANGEIFDMNELTAAHKTLQMPSLVRVTNLENGRSLIVRVNDRGPFKRSRVIDVSKRAAELLGFKNQGTAKVKLDVLSNESRQIAEAAIRGEDTRGVEVALNENRRVPSRRVTATYQPSIQPAAGTQTASASGVRIDPNPMKTANAENALLVNDQSGPIKNEVIPGHLKNGNFMPDPVIQEVPVQPTNIYIQAASFSEQGNAQNFASQLRSYGTTKIVPANIKGKQFYRVRIGPLNSVPAADALMSRLASAGHNNAIVVID